MRDTRETLRTFPNLGQPLFATSEQTRTNQKKAGTRSTTVLRGTLSGPWNACNQPEFCWQVRHFSLAPPLAIAERLGAQKPRFQVRFRGFFLSGNSPTDAANAKDSCFPDLSPGAVAAAPGLLHSDRDPRFEVSGGWHRSYFVPTFMLHQPPVLLAFVGSQATFDFLGRDKSAATCLQRDLPAGKKQRR